MIYLENPHLYFSETLLSFQVPELHIFSVPKQVDLTCQSLPANVWTNCLVCFGSRSSPDIHTNRWSKRKDKIQSNNRFIFTYIVLSAIRFQYKGSFILTAQTLSYDLSHLEQSLSKASVSASEA